jgi:hypothetical protein
MHAGHLCTKKEKNKTKKRRYFQRWQGVQHLAIAIHQKKCEMSASKGHCRKGQSDKGTVLMIHESFISWLKLE